MRSIPFKKPKNKFFRLAEALVRRYFNHDVGKSAAALTYYFIFSFFPFLIFLSSLLGRLNLNPLPVEELRAIIPDDVLNLVNMYLEYVSETQSQALLIFGLVFSIWFPMRAVSSLMDDINKAWHITRRRSPIARQLVVLAMTVGVLLTIVLSLVLTMAGSWLLTFLARFIHIPLDTIRIWDLLRFFLLGTVMLVLISLLYLLAPNKPMRPADVIPGTIATLVCWLAFSAAFSFYVENIARYSLLYGSIGGIIVLLMWLYALSVVLIMGSELNGALAELRGKTGSGEK